MNHPIAVIGAAGMDVCSHTEKSLSLHEVNPGEISLSFGGSGYRIARDLALLGLSPALFTLFGKDFCGRLLASACRDAGIDLRGAGESELPSSAALTVLGERGQAALQISDARLSSEMDRAFFARRLSLLNGAEACLFGAELSEDACVYLTGAVKAPLFALGISPGKCTRLAPVLSGLFGGVFSLIEARRLTGRLSPGDCAAALCDKGIKLVLLTLGAEGFLLASGSDRITRPASFRPSASPFVADAAAAALLWGFAERLSLREIAWAVSAAAAAAGEARPLSPGILRDADGRR